MAAMSLFTWSVSAEDPTLELEVSPTSARVGDHVRVLAHARGGADGWLWGELTVSVSPDGPWAVVDGPTPVPETRPPVWELILAPLELGEQTLPAIVVSARSGDGEAQQIGCPEPPAVEVVSVLSGEEDDQQPAPIRDPIGVRGLPWEWILPALAVLLPLFAAFAWWWRGRQTVPAAVYEALPPFEQLEAVLGDLEARIGREPADGICDGLAAGLRRFLERRTGEPAGEMTSFELRLLARRREWPEAVQRMVQQVMGVADGVRFSRRPAGDDELRRALSLALETGRAVETFLSQSDDDRVAAEGG